jgi:dephospho-CoA kinase
MTGVDQLRVALTGGVGSGKSSLGRALADCGAVRFDADVVAREVVEPHTIGLAAVVQRFGHDVLNGDGTLDRSALAAVAFAHDSARRDLNAILHPLIALRSSELMDGAPNDAIIVYEIPLLAESGSRAGFDVVVVVQTPLGLRLTRLAERGLSEPDARARIATQANDEQRRAMADELVVNDGSPSQLQAEARRLWSRLEKRRISRAFGS